MKTKFTYKIFDREKSYEELLYSVSNWMDELQFITIELDFLVTLIKTYSFNKTVPNLYERLQLFVLELEQFSLDKNNINKKINYLKIKINESQKIEKFNRGNNFYLVLYENSAKEISDYLREYKKLKAKIFEYVSRLI